MSEISRFTGTQPVVGLPAIILTYPPFFWQEISAAPGRNSDGYELHRTGKAKRGRGAGSCCACCDASSSVCTYKQMSAPVRALETGNKAQEDCYHE